MAQRIQHLVPRTNRRFSKLWPFCMPPWNAKCAFARLRSLSSQRGACISVEKVLCAGTTNSENESVVTVSPHDKSGPLLTMTSATNVGLCICIRGSFIPPVKMRASVFKSRLFHLILPTVQFPDGSGVPAMCAFAFACAHCAHVVMFVAV